MEGNYELSAEVAQDEAWWQRTMRDIRISLARRAYVPSDDRWRGSLDEAFEES